MATHSSGGKRPGVIRALPPSERRAPAARCTYLLRAPAGSAARSAPAAGPRRRRAWPRYASVQYLLPRDAVGGRFSQPQISAPDSCHGMASCERVDNVLPFVWPIWARGRDGWSNQLEPNPNFTQQIGPQGEKSSWPELVSLDSRI